jgi:hypothetical protein
MTAPLFQGVPLVRHLCLGLSESLTRKRVEFLPGKDLSLHHGVPGVDDQSMATANAQSNELGAFLRARRAELTRQAFGLQDAG